jgi:hypothetical protein
LFGIPIKCARDLRLCKCAHRALWSTHLLRARYFALALLVGQNAGAVLFMRSVRAGSASLLYSNAAHLVKNSVRMEV